MNEMKGEGIRSLLRTSYCNRQSEETSLLFFFLRLSLLSPVKTAISRLRESRGRGNSKPSRRKLNQNFRLGAAKRAEMYIKAAVLKT